MISEQNIFVAGQKLTVLRHSIVLSFTVVCSNHDIEDCNVVYLILKSPSVSTYRDNRVG